MIRYGLSVAQLLRLGLEALLRPPGWPEDAIDTVEGKRIAADWWEESGDEQRAAQLRALAV